MSKMLYKKRSAVDTFLLGTSVSSNNSGAKKSKNWSAFDKWAENI